MKYIYSTLILCIFQIACFDNLEPKNNVIDNSYKVTINQGIWGDVLFWEGNHMPSPDSQPPYGPIYHVSRNIYVFESTPTDDVIVADELGPSFYAYIFTGLVEQTISDSEGFYQFRLQPGNYSLFVEEQSNFYANLYSNCCIFPFEVFADSVLHIDFDINYAASF